MAATGSTLTARAAARGSTLQPATSSSTTRKMTAVSAAERRARATAGRSASGESPAASARRPPASGPRPRTAQRATASPGTTSGTCARKIARQSNASVSAPPRAGPIAAPKMEAVNQSRRPGPSWPASSSAKTPIRAAAPPTAWTPRSHSRPSSVSERPQASEAAPKTAIPPAAVNGPPIRRDTQTSGSSATASTAV